MAKVIKIFSSIAVLVIVAITLFYFAANKNKTVTDVYKIQDITFKFALPNNWKQTKLIPGMLMFSPADQEPVSIAMLSISVFPGNDFIKEPYSEEFLKNVASTFKNDPNYKVVTEEIISFAGTKALNLVTETAYKIPIKVKQKVLIFVKGNRQFLIQFNAEKEKFVIFLPAIDRALKTFEFVSQGSNTTNSDIKEESFHCSLDLRNKFNTILEKMYFEIFTVAKKNNDTWLLNETAGASLQEKSQNAASEFFFKNNVVLDVPEPEARRILGGKIDDSKNLSDIKDCLTKFMDARLPVPPVIQHLINKYRSHALSGLELELTARIFKEQLKQIAI